MKVKYNGKLKRYDCHVPIKEIMNLDDLKPTEKLILINFFIHKENWDFSINGISNGFTPNKNRNLIKTKLDNIINLGYLSISNGNYILNIDVIYNKTKFNNTVTDSNTPVTPDNIPAIDDNNTHDTTPVTLDNLGGTKSNLDGTLDNTPVTESNLNDTESTTNNTNKEEKSNNTKKEEKNKKSKFFVSNLDAAEILGLYYNNFLSLDKENSKLSFSQYEDLVFFFMFKLHNQDDLIKILQMEDEMYKMNKDFKHYSSQLDVGNLKNQLKDFVYNQLDRII